MIAPWVARAVRRPEAAPLAFLLLIALVLGVTTRGFLSSANLLDIVSQVAVVGIVSLALNQVILSGEIDVSLGSLLAACAFTYTSAALAAGLGIGLLNGLIVTIGRVPSIIATLGMLLALRGVVLLVGANGVLLVPDGVRGLGLGHVLGLRAPIVALALALLWQIIFRRLGEALVTVRASYRWWSREEVEDGLPDGRHARLWRRCPDSFFSAPLL